MAVLQQTLELQIEQFVGLKLVKLLFNYFAGLKGARLRHSPAFNTHLVRGFSFVVDL